MDKEMYDTFWYWINERHQIYLNRQKGMPKPWTKDPIFQEWKFTNVFRQLDKVTVWFMDNIITPHINDGPLLLANIATHRYFNWPDTSEAMGYITEWNPLELEKILLEREKLGCKIFTGAYMVTGGAKGGTGRKKISLVLHDFLAPIWENKEIILAETLEETCTNFRLYPGWKSGGFAAYEVVTDLTYTPMLCNASDKNTWANAGPGAKRGLERIYGYMHEWEYLQYMRLLLVESVKYVGDHVPMLDMRAIEHSLCEFSKYVRIKEGTGRARSRYNGRS